MESLPLITSWADYAAAAARLIAAAQHSIVIYDRDLLALRLEQPACIASLGSFLRHSPTGSLRIAVRDATPLRTRSPRLLDLLRIYAHRMEIRETPEHLAGLSDSLLFADGSSGLVRFHHDHARSREIVADPEACQPYCKRFADIWAEGGTPVAATTAGL